eukprot:Amastigsp_a1004_210.p3 type:complete len:119 gc:universal Amastigsp_a1004_210:249-605(+)
MEEVDGAVDHLLVNDLHFLPHRELWARGCGVLRLPAAARGVQRGCVHWVPVEEREASPAVPCAAMVLPWRGVLWSLRRHGRRLRGARGARPGLAPQPPLVHYVLPLLHRVCDVRCLAS